MESQSVDRVYRIEVTPRSGEAPDDYLLSDIAALGIHAVRRVLRSDLYFIRGAVDDEDVARLCRDLLSDPIVERVRWALAATKVSIPEGAVRVEVGLLQGVTDSVARNLLGHARLLGVNSLQAAASGQAYSLFGELDEQQIHTIASHLLYNDVIQYYQLGQIVPHVGVVPPAATVRAEIVSIAQMGGDALLELSRERLLSLDLAEMRAVQRYFGQEGREPTDVELESIAQTWSEHCGHKTFKGVVEYTETTSSGITHERIDSLLKTYLQAATNEIDAPWVRSAFVDNAGIIDFADGPAEGTPSDDTPAYEVSFKVETHNHPSALEPFGGANTGVGGVIRDIIGVSARPIANTDILCFGPEDTDLAQLPAGVLHPRRIYAGVVKGVEDYGNKMGIPTVNGSIVFEPGYTANPLVYCGCVGIAPVGMHPRTPKPGDLVVVLGGRTGRDGLHGATFSSVELTDKTGVTSGGAVQIGNPITEKMMLDAILLARDERLYSAITDCGAGGLSSAVSEMGEEIGVAVQLDLAPLKYHGLQPWEIWLSEAQERMVLAVPPENETRLRQVCDGYSVEMTVIGTFSDDRRLRLYYGNQAVADLSIAFLHGGVPRRVLQASWSMPLLDIDAADGPHGARGYGAATPEILGQTLLEILRHPNVRSKEDVVRRYDHEVQGGTIIKPFVGVESDGPSDAAVIKPLEVADSWRGLALGCGFNPAYGETDPYPMAISAIDEAVRNVVCVGADPDRIAILDNFCWGNPLLPDRMGALVRACKGCYDGAVHYQTPFISGKDSLNNEYLDGVTGRKVAIPPSLLISAIGIVPDVRRACTMDLKQAGHHLYVLGETKHELGGSYLYRLQGRSGGTPPGLAQHGPETARALHRAIVDGLVSACHDCSEGGLAVALAEMAIAGRLGLRVSLASVPVLERREADDEGLLFAESNGRYVVEVPADNVAAFEARVRSVPHSRIGQVTRGEQVIVTGCHRDETVFSLSVAELTNAWRGHLDDSASTGSDGEGRA